MDDAIYQRTCGSILRCFPTPVFFEPLAIRQDRQHHKSREIGKFAMRLEVAMLVVLTGLTTRTVADAVTRRRALTNT